MQLCTYNSAYITHVSVFQIWQTDLEQIRNRINNNLIAGRFGPIGLCQLRTRVLYCNQVVINSATYGCHSNGVYLLKTLSAVTC